MLGYCLRLNDDQKLVQIVPGVQGGFSIILNAFVDDYMPNIVSYGVIAPSSKYFRVCSFIKVDFTKTTTIKMFYRKRKVLRCTCELHMKRC